MKRVITNTIAAAALLVAASTLQAQATRTWVSGVGDDVNPCSRTAPCKTWAGAISKTAAGGEIDALDPGGFGTLTITKSITVDGTQGAGFGSTLNSGGISGFNVNDSATGTPNTIKVILRNLSINGAGTTLGLNGVNFTSGLSLTMENCEVMNQSSRGVSIQRANGAPTGTVTIINSTFQNIGAGAIVANATASTGAVKIAITDSRMVNAASGVFAGNNSEFSIARSTIANNTTAGVDAGSNGVVNVDDTTIMNNATGVQTASTATVRLSRNLIVQNAVRGINVTGGAIQSYGDNYFAGNGADVGVLTSIAAQKK